MQYFREWYFYWKTSILCTHNAEGLLVECLLHYIVTVPSKLLIASIRIISPYISRSRFIFLQFFWVYFLPGDVASQQIKKALLETYTTNNLICI